MDNKTVVEEGSVGVELHERPPRGRLIFLLFGLSFVHGLALNLMPVLFPTIGKAFHLPKSQQGLLQTAFTVGMISALIVAGYLINYIGAKRITIVVLMLTGLGAVAFGTAGTYTLVLGSAMLMGMGLATLTAVYAAVITVEFADIRQRMYMWTFAVLAGSATIGTSLIGGLVNRIGYHTVFVIFGVSIWAWAAFLMVVAGKALDGDVGKAHLGNRERPTGERSVRQKVSSLLRFLSEGLLNRGALYMLGLLVVLDTLAAGNLLAWTPSYFGETYKLANVGLVLSASSAGVFAGRMLLGALPPGFISDRILLGICYTGAMISFGMILLFHPSMAVSIILVGLTGAFIAAQAPTTYSIATDKFGERAPAAIPLIDAMGNGGGIIGPPLMGVLADRAGGGLLAAMYFIPICGFALVALVLTWEVVDRIRRARVCNRRRAGISRTLS